MSWFTLNLLNGLKVICDLVFSPGFAGSSIIATQKNHFFCQVWKNETTNQSILFIHIKKKTMKKLLIATLLVMATVAGAFAQSSQVKVIALMNKASWCPVCQDHAMAFMKDMAPMVMKNPEVKMVINDLSNDQTRESSMPMLESAGIKQFALENDATGRIYFIDARTKKLLSSVSIAQSNKDIMRAYKEALKRS